MRLSRSKILRWRWVIYVLLILWFLPGAWKRWQSTREDGESEGVVSGKDSDMPLPTSYHVLPDGTKVPVYELSPEQARLKFGIEGSKEDPVSSKSASLESMKPDPALRGPTQVDPNNDKNADSGTMPEGSNSTSGIQEPKSEKSSTSNSVAKDGEKKNGT